MENSHLKNLDACPNMPYVKPNYIFITYENKLFKKNSFSFNNYTFKVPGANCVIFVQIKKTFGFKIIVLEQQQLLKEASLIYWQ